MQLIIDMYSFLTGSRNVPNAAAYAVRRFVQLVQSRWEQLVGHAGCPSVYARRQFLRSLCRVGMLVSVLFPTSVLALEQPGRLTAKDKVCYEHQQQPQRRGPQAFRPEKFKKDLQAHIRRQAELTQEEARQFFPIFFEMKDKLRNLDHQKNRALRRAAKAGGSEADCKRVMALQVQLNRKRNKVYEEYTERLAKVVSYRKLVKACEADQSFGRKMFRQMTGGPHRQGGEKK